MKKLLSTAMLAVASFTTAIADDVFQAKNVYIVGIETPETIDSNGDVMSSIGSWNMWKVSVSKTPNGEACKIYYSYKHIDFNSNQGRSVYALGVAAMMNQKPVTLTGQGGYFAAIIVGKHYELNDMTEITCSSESN
ncbi:MULTISPECIES: hypothetical protein [Cysteiniphilum]|uniref:hypothetical protein n=1 Tax=Cysteiniphilum TaxID=2056696 RepID=UPI00178645C8|nr:MULTISPECIES: hypothetical protein [Cysteiniphilum]